MNSSVLWRHWRPDVKMYAAGNSTDSLKLGQPKFSGRSETSPDNHSSLMRSQCRKAAHKAMKPKKPSFGKWREQRRENTSRKNRHFLLMPPRVWCSVSTLIPMVTNTKMPENYLIPVLMTSLPVQWPSGKGCDKWPLFPYLVFSCRQRSPWWDTQKPPRLLGAEQTGSGQKRAMRWGY